MKNILILILISLNISNSQIANDNHIYIENQNHIGCGKYHSFEKIKNHQSFELQNAIDFPRRNYNILQIDLELDWINPLSSDSTFGEDRKWTGFERITLVVDSSNTKIIEFDASNLKIDNIKEIKSNNEFTFENKNSLIINFNNNLQVGDTLIFEIDYTYMGSDDVGFLLVKKGDAPERLAYTMSQPYDARHWLICNDYPYEKQMFTLKLKVPKDFIGASNGLYKDIIEKDDYTEFQWEHQYPIASYLMVVNASKFYTYDYKVARIENPFDSILIDNYIWEGDLTKEPSDPQWAPDASITLNQIPDMVEYFQEIYGPYPFEKFGTVTVEKFWAAGMEHQSIQTIRRSFLNGGWGLLVHELAHMWLGDLVSPTSWRDIWLNEGGAQWAEAIWQGVLQEDGYNYKMNDIKQFYFKNAPGIAQPPIYLDDIESTVFGNNRWYIIYQKSSWIYHQLRNFIGEEEFFQILKEYLKEYAYQSVNGEQFISFFEQRATNPLVPIRKFFDQFLYSAGHPMISFRYEIESNNEGNSLINLELEQIQKTYNIRHPLTLDSYEFPLVIDIFKDGEITKDTIIVKNELEYHQFKLTFVPDSIVPNEAFSFFQLVKYASSVKQTQEISEMKCFPNPLIINQEINIELNVDKSNYYELDLLNIQGEKVQNLYKGFIPEGIFTHKSMIKSELSSGIYFLTVVGDKQKAFKIIVE